VGHFARHILKWVCRSGNCPLALPRQDRDFLCARVRRWFFLGFRDCLFGQPFPAVGDASQCGYGISYGGGSSYIQGQLVVDEVTVGGYTVNNTIVYVTRQVRAEVSILLCRRYVVGEAWLALAQCACVPVL
jgi:hypothetical protein